MHHSLDENDFRNAEYLKEMEMNFKHMMRAYHKYIAYRNKLLNELTLSDSDRKILYKNDVKFKSNIERMAKRIDKVDFDYSK